MRTVIYTHDFEPITAITLAGWMADYLNAEGRVSIPILEPVPCEPATREWAQPMTLRQVTLTVEWLTLRGQRHMLLFTNDEVDAMLLRSAFLPGQRRALREAEDKAFSDGVYWLFQRAMRGGA